MYGPAEPVSKASWDWKGTAADIFLERRGPASCAECGHYGPLVPTKPSNMEVMTEQDHQCDQQDSNEWQWTATMTYNVILALGFSLSCLIEEPWIWARLVLILGYSVGTRVAIINCQAKTFLWTILIILTNLYKLMKLAYDHRPSKVPKLLQVSLTLGQI